MKTYLSVLLVVSSIAIFSCKKDHTSSNQPPPNDTTPAVPKDTLATGWSKVVVSGSPVFFDVFFINEIGFAMSDSAIYKSTDGGASWSQLVAGQGHVLNMGMGSETNAAFAMHPQRIVFTNNGGASFDTAVVADQTISDVFFVDPLKVYAVGNSFWRSTDAGSHWTKLSDFPHSSNYQTLFFLDSLTGWAARTDGLYKTIDGGTTWLPVNEGSDVAVAQTGVVFFTSANHGFIADLNIAAATQNAGTTWSKIWTASSDTYHDMHFVNDNVGYVTDGQYIRKTVDGGATWTKEAVIPGTIFYEVHFSDANHGWACGSGGVILKFQQ